MVGEGQVTLSGLNEQTDSPLIQLPLDIFVMIFKLLDKYDQVVLALTCKGLVQWSQKQRLKYNPWTKKNDWRDWLIEIDSVEEYAKFLLRVGPASIVEQPSPTDGPFRPRARCLCFRPTAEVNFWVEVC